jgi:hypothetical protein
MADSTPSFRQSLRNQPRRAKGRPDIRNVRIGRRGLGRETRGGRSRSAGCRLRGDSGLLQAARALRVHPWSMDSTRAAAEPGGTASDRREALAERGRAGDERERAGDERQRKANARECLADEREREADERERLADEREHLADEREREAGRRETALIERQREADERKRELDERGRVLSSVAETLEKRTLETIERSRALLALSEQRLNRQEAAVRREQARRERQQREIDRASAESERGLAARLPDPGKPIEQAEALRKRTRAAIEAFAATEDEIARIHEELAASCPDRRSEYRRTAEQARKAARHARETLRTFTE